MKNLKINRYKLKDGITEKELSKYNLRNGGKYIMADATTFLSEKLIKDITLDLCFPKNLSKWNDFDYILVLDEEFGQPYTPFYNFIDGETPNNVSPFLRRVVANYNRVMDSFDFLEKLPGKELKRED